MIMGAAFLSAIRLSTMVFIAAEDSPDRFVAVGAVEEIEHGQPGGRLVVSGRRVDVGPAGRRGRLRVVQPDVDRAVRHLLDVVEHRRPGRHVEDAFDEIRTAVVASRRGCADRASRNRRR